MSEEKTCSFGCNHTKTFTQMQEYIEESLINKRRSFLSIQCPEKVLVRTMMGKAMMQCDSFLSYEQFLEYANEKSIEFHKGLLKTVPQDNPTSLADFNYHFNEKGELRNIETGKPFHYISETHYEALGDFIVQEIQNKMVKECDMVEVFLPEGDEYKNAPKTNIFMTKDALTCDKLLLIIQGSGAVRAGMWARALCLNDTLHTGAVLDYIHQAKSEGYGVIVLNPNKNSAPKKEDPFRRSRKGFLYPKKLGPYPQKDVVEIPEHDSPPQHVISVWDKVVSKAKAKDIVTVSHSAGGHGTLMLLRYREDDVLKRLRAIAFTDSVHSIGKNESQGVKKFIMENSVNWVTSKEKLDTKVGYREGCLCVSAGHDTHENTSSSAQVSVFKFLQMKLENKN